MLGGRALAVAAALLVATATAAWASVELDRKIRGGGVQLSVPDGWSRVAPAEAPKGADARTLLVVGTQDVRPLETGCLVASYRVPADGAAVVVIGWKRPSEGEPLFGLADMRLRKPTFECFSGRGAFAQVSRRGHDYQVNVLVGDRASAATVAEALAVARSFALSPI